MPIFPLVIIQKKPKNINMQFLVPVTWAQRSSESDETRNYLYVFINVPDVPPSSAKVDINSTSVSFTGTDIKGKKYSVKLDLYAEIDTENSKTHHTPRGVEMVLRKKTLGLEYWPRLLKEAKKVHFVKTDFDKVCHYASFFPVFILIVSSGSMRMSKTRPWTTTTQPTLAASARKAASVALISPSLVEAT